MDDIIKDRENKEIIEALNRLQNSPDWKILCDVMEEYELKRVEGILLSEEELTPDKRKTLINMRKFISHFMNIPENYLAMFTEGRREDSYDPYN